MVVGKCMIRGMKVAEDRRNEVVGKRLVRVDEKWGGIKRK